MFYKAGIYKCLAPWNIMHGASGSKRVGRTRGCWAYAKSKQLWKSAPRWWAASSSPTRTASDAHRSQFTVGPTWIHLDSMGEPHKAGWNRTRAFCLVGRQGIYCSLWLLGVSSSSAVQCLVRKLVTLVAAEKRLQYVWISLLPLFSYVSRAGKSYILTCSVYLMPL